MLDKIQQLKDEIQNLHVSSAAEVEDLRIKYLSKKGAISFGKLGKLSGNSVGVDRGSDTLYL